jgi:hypothetical protein
MSSQAGQPAYASAAQVQSLQTQLEDLQRQIRALDAARAQDKKEIYDDISKKIATILKSSSASSAAAVPAVAPALGLADRHRARGAARRIPLQDRRRLWRRMNVLVEENGLSDPGNIRVGQKLFIPD